MLLDLKDLPVDWLIGLGSLPPFLSSSLYLPNAELSQTFSALTKDVQYLALTPVPREPYFLVILSQ